MSAKEKTPARNGGPKKSSGRQVGKPSAVDDTTMVSPAQTCDTDSSPEHTVTPKLADEHLEELRNSAISDEVIESSGIYTAYTKEDLPDPLQWVGEIEGALPALVYPQVEAGRGQTWQVKPQPGSVVLADGRRPKYIGPSKDSGYPTCAVFELRPVSDTTRKVFIVEGTKQSRSVESIVGEDAAVYGLAGITTWQAREDLSGVFQEFFGLPVYIIPDADAAANRMVYDGAAGLGEMCKQLGASPVRFIGFPGGGKQGIDDVLGGIALKRRSEMFEVWVDKAIDKPARKRPSMASMKKQADDLSVDSSKPFVNDDVDIEVFYDAVDRAVFDRFAGKELFRSGDKLVALSSRDGRKHLDVVELPHAIDLATKSIRG